MSPSVTTGPSSSQAAFINGGGLASNKTNGLDGPKAGGQPMRPLEEIVAAQPDVDIYTPIRKILLEGDSLAKQADTHLDFRRPDIALEDYIKASIIAVDIIPRHKDYPSLQADRGDLHRLYMGLKKRINAQNKKFEDVKDFIKQDNLRYGTRPSNSVPIGYASQISSRESSQNSMRPPQNITNNGHSRSVSVGGIGSGNSLFSNGSTAISTNKVRPPVQPKPNGLHGNAISSTNDGSAPDLATRLARLRASDRPVQDPRIRTQNIANGISSSSASPRSSTDYSQRNLPTSNSRLVGPRDMPSPPTAIPGKSPSLPPISMPRPPDAIYHPGRNTDPSVPINLLSSVGRSASFRNGNIVSPTSRSVSGNNTPTEFTKARKLTIPDTPTISTEDLMSYIRMGSGLVKILLIDLRARNDFEGGHIMTQSIICIEPIMLRHNISAEELGERIVLSPESEQKLFEQRQEYDLIVYYDQSSTSIENTGYGSTTQTITDFRKAIFDYAYEKAPKRCPKLLVGGLDAWIDLIGQNGLQTTTKGAAPLARRDAKRTRPLGKVTMVEDVKAAAIAKRQRVYQSRPLTKEEENKWDTTLKEETENDRRSTIVDSPQEFYYARSAEDFVRRYPELPSVQESMTSVRPAIPHQQQMAPLIPPAPIRPPPAIPRQSFTGISEKAPLVTAYAMEGGASTNTITSANVTPGLTGLTNFGATCYMNSALQCLSATPAFRKFMLNYSYPPIRIPPKKAAETSEPPQLMVRTLSNLIRHIWSGHYDYVTPSTFRAYLYAVSSTKVEKEEAFGSPGRQHDSSEFLEFLLGIMNDELNMKRNIPSYEEQEAKLSAAEKANRNSLPLEAISQHEWSRYSTTDDSLLQQNFRSICAFNNRCTNCRNTFRRFQPQSILTLNLKDVGQQSLVDALGDRYKSAERLENYDCDVCNAPVMMDNKLQPPGIKTTAERTERLLHAPRYLIVQLVRENLGTKIEFPINGLDMSPYFADSTGRSAEFIYDLYGVTQHSGTLNSGHYWAYTKQLDPSANAEQWYRFEDTMVKPCVNIKKATQNHEDSVLFYVRRARG